MSKKWLVLIVVAGCALLGTACQQTAQDAGASLEKQAEEAAELVEDVVADTGEAAGDMMQEAAQKLDAETKAMYDEVAAQLQEKQGELKTVQEKIAAMSPQDLLADDGKALKNGAEQLTTEIGTLQAKLEELVGEAG